MVAAKTLFDYAKSIGVVSFWAGVASESGEIDLGARYRLGRRIHNFEATAYPEEGRTASRGPLVDNRSFAQIALFMALVGESCMRDMEEWGDTRCRTTITLR